MNRKKGDLKRIRKPAESRNSFEPDEIEITVDETGMLWLASSVPLMEKEKGQKNILCG